VHYPVRRCLDWATTRLGNLMQRKRINQATVVTTQSGIVDSAPPLTLPAPLLLPDQRALLPSIALSAASSSAVCAVPISKPKQARIKREDTRCKCRPRADHVVIPFRSLLSFAFTQVLSRQHSCTPTLHPLIISADAFNNPLCTRRPQRRFT
jgi:hypothetical protein